LKPDGTTPAGDGFVVTVNNVTQNLSLQDTTGATAGASKYVVTFTDFNKPVFAENDQVDVTVTDATTGDVLATAQVTVTAADLGASFLEVDLNLMEGMEEVVVTDRD